MKVIDSLEMLIVIKGNISSLLFKFQNHESLLFKF